MPTKTKKPPPKKAAPKSPEPDNWIVRHVGAQFRAARERLKLSAQDVSVACGGAVHPRMVTQYETTTTPKIDTFLILCAVYGLLPAAVLGPRVAGLVQHKKAEDLAELFAAA